MEDYDIEELIEKAREGETKYVFGIWLGFFIGALVTLIIMSS